MDHPSSGLASYWQPFVIRFFTKVQTRYIRIYRFWGQDMTTTWCLSDWSF
jgi:hypothetical protein